MLCLPLGALRFAHGGVSGSARQVRSNEKRRQAESLRREEQELRAAEEWSAAGQHTWWGREGGGAPVRGRGFDAPDEASLDYEPRQGLSDFPVMGGGCSYAGGNAHSRATDR